MKPKYRPNSRAVTGNRISLRRRIGLAASAATLVPILTLSLGGHAWAASHNWTAGTGGGNINWSSLTNWSDSATPTSKDTVFTNTGGAAGSTVTSIVDTSYTINSLNFRQDNTVNQTMSISSGQTLTVNGSFTPTNGAATAVLFGPVTDLNSASGYNTTYLTGDGTFTVNNSAANFLVGFANSTTTTAVTVDMSGLATFNATVNIFGVGREGFKAASGARQQAGVLRLAKNSTITATQLSIGDTTGIDGATGSYNNGNGSTLYLAAGGNAVNNLNVGSISMGVGKAAGNMYFNSGAVASDKVTIRGSSGGSSAVSTWDMAYRNMSSSSGTPGSTVDFGAGQVDALVTTLNIARWGATGGGNNISPSATFTTGTNSNSNISVSTVNIALDSTTNAPTTAQTMTGTLNVTGGAFAANTVNLATGSNTSSLTRTATLNVDGGTFLFGSFGTQVGGYAINFKSGTVGSTNSTARSLVLNYNLGKAGGSTVTFGQASGGTGTLTFSGTGTLQDNTTVETLVDTTLSGALGGGYSLTKTGAASLIIGQNMTYSGGTIVNAGSLTMSSTKTLASGSNMQVGSSGAWYLNGTSQTIGQLSGSGTVGDTWSHAGTDTLTVASGTFSGTITGGNGTSVQAIALTKTGVGTLTLSGANTYTGGTNVSGGTLALSGSGTLGASTGTLKVTNNAILDLGGTTQQVGQVGASGAGNGVVGTIQSGTLNIQANSMMFQNGTLSADVTSTAGSNGRLWIGGDANATVLLGGNNTIQFSDHNSTIIGYLPITGAAGTVKLTSATALGPNTESVQVFTGTLDLNGQTGVTCAQILLSSGASSVLANNNTSTASSFGGNIQSSSGAQYGGAGNLTLSGSVSGGDLTKIGAGTLTLSGSTANTYSGTTTVSNGELDLNKSASVNAVGGNVTVNGGTLKWLANEQMGNGTTIALSLTSGTVNLNGKTETLGTFTNSGGTFTTGAGTLIGTGSTVTWSGGTNTINDGGSVQDGHIVISGGANTVQGGATGGVLQLNSGGTGLEMSNGSALTLNSDAAVAGKLKLDGNVTSSGDSTVTIANGGSAANNGTIDLNGATSTFTVADGAAATDMSISAVIDNGSLTKAGAGTLALTAANTYTGNTTVNAGTLVLSNNSAAGTGGVAISGTSAATLKITSGVTVANNITFSNTNAASSVIREVGAGSAYDVGTSGNLTSSLAGGKPDTTASILAGINSGSTATLTMGFSGTSSATNDGIRRSNVFSLSGTTISDAFVLQITASGLASDSVLGWKNDGGLWDFAVSGNTGNNATAPEQNYLGSFASFEAINGSVLSSYIGAYGVDTASGAVWAVVNHGGEFTAVPEPTSALVGLLIGAGMLRRRRTS